MLYQIHQEFHDGTSTMYAQQECNSQEEIDLFWKEVRKKYFLTGVRWMICNEKADQFTLVRGTVRNYSND